MLKGLTVRVLFFVIVVCTPSAASAQTTEFTYQGQLQSASAPATGSFDFEFLLFDAATGGAQIGTTLAKSAVTVTGGSFAVKLDFGASFPGANRFLEIHVRTAGGGAYTSLAPRQLVNSAPYAVKAFSSDNATNATTAVTATNATQLGGVAASGFIQNTTSPQATSNFNISGDGTAGGTLSANTVNATTQLNLGGSRILANPGTNNLFVGENTGTVSTGNLNTFIGPGAGQANTVGSSNVFVGTGAGQANTTGLANAIVGRLAGTNNTTGFYNALFGAGAGRYNTTGNANTFIGESAGYSNTTGYQNSFFGHLAGDQNDTGSNNAFLGIAAGQNNTTGLGNTFVGGGTASANTTGQKNTTLGYLSNLGAADLSNATAIGSFAFATQNNSIVLGSIAGVNGASVDTNVGIGTTTPSSRLHVLGNSFFDGSLTITGTLNAPLPGGSANYVQNTTTPQASSNFNISGNGTAGGTLSSNVVNAVTQFNLAGSRILSNAGSNNLFAGVGSGTANTSGNMNSFFGTSAGTANTSGSQNAIFGQFAGQANTLGGNNSFFGMSSGVGNTTGNNNTFFGVGSGVTNTTGSNNSSLGYSANVGVNNLTNATAIGSQAYVTQSNSIVLGSINNVNSATSNTNVGIGTTSPSYPFSVVGSAGTGPGQAVAEFASNVNDTGVRLNNTAANGHTWTLFSSGGTSGLCAGCFTLYDTTLSQSRLTADTGGNIGIGTLSPGAKLHVNGTIRLDTLGAGGSTQLCHNGSNQISTCSSSARYKNNIISFTPGLDLVKKLRPVSFSWRDSGMLDMGLVAEEVNKAEPLLTTTNAKGEVEGVKYDRISVVLVNAVKEQQAQIEAQSAKIERQRNEIAGLKALVCSKNKKAPVCRSAK